MNTVTAIRDLGKVDTGGSNAHFFLCSDQKEYVVKFVESGKKTTVNELVGGTLAWSLKLPTPRIVKVMITEGLINLQDELKKRNIPAGFHIGIERLPSSAWSFNYPIEEKLHDKTLINTSELYGVIGFDNWVINTDRDNKGNNMIDFLPNNKIKYMMIDFGHCFTNNEWNENLQNSINSTNMMGVFNFIKRHVRDFVDFEYWIKEIESFQDNVIDSIVSNVPDTWNLSPNERAILLNFIISRKRLIRAIVNNNRTTIGSWQLV